MKCCRYWPDPSSDEEPNGKNGETSIICDNIKVKFEKLTKVSEEYYLRQFSLTEINTDKESNKVNDYEDKSLTVFQFQYFAWTDHGVPDNVQNTIKFVEHFNKVYKDLNKNTPITTHCRYFYECLIRY